MQQNNFHVGVFWEKVCRRLLIFSTDRVICGRGGKGF